jgi:hypothetical protein
MLNYFANNIVDSNISMTLVVMIIVLYNNYIDNKINYAVYNNNLAYNHVNNLVYNNVK